MRCFLIALRSAAFYMVGVTEEKVCYESVYSARNNARENADYYLTTIWGNIGKVPKPLQDNGY